MVAARTLRVDGRTVAFETAGVGMPLVVLESGLGDSMKPWDPVFARIARFTRVFRYDRAGYGGSQAAPSPRSFAALASELHAVLRAARERPPYLLVGHSLGGGIIRAFAHQFPAEVAGMVFVDPLSEEMFARVTPAQVKEEMAGQRAAAANGPAGLRAELTFLESEVLANFPELRSFSRPPEVPMVLLIAGTDRPPGWVQAVLDQYGPWLTGGGEGRIIFSSQSTHYIQVDEPATVVEAVRRVVFPDLERRLARSLDAGGAREAIALYRQLVARYPAAYLSERILNRLGYRQLAAHKVADAIALFRLNVERYPRSANVYDSLGEAYMAAGERERAIANYRKSLALDPKNQNAVRMLEKLGAPVRDRR